MPVNYISPEQAIDAQGLRMLVVSGVPSPWGEAAKGLLHVKGIDWQAVRLVYDDPALTKWADGHLGAPVAFYNDEPAISDWRDILLLVERIAPEPALLPIDKAEREVALCLCADLIGEGGLAWSRRMQGIHGGLEGTGGFNRRVAKFLAGRYNYTPELGREAGQRVVALLKTYAERLTQQRDGGSAFYLGQSLSAVDIYSAVCMALVDPLPEDECAMDPKTRAVFASTDAATKAALDPILLEHREMIYQRFLELPLSL